MTAVEKMSQRERERERLRIVDKRRGGEMQVPMEGRGSDGMLVSLCPSKRSNSSSEGR